MILSLKLILIIHFLHTISPSEGFIEGLYCGKENCYEILEVGRESTKSEISKSYRKLARKWHPDMHKGKKAKEEAQPVFLKIANAYEILRDEEQRTDYDYMLDHPDEYYSHYFYYYRTRVAPKVDIRIVIVATILVISGIQYLGAWNNYKTAIQYLSKEPKYRLRAIDIAKHEGLIGAKKRDRRSKEEIKEEEENIIRKIIAEKMDIRGGYSKPQWTDMLLIQLIFSPYYLVIYIHWCFRWIWKFNICRHEYGDEEKTHLIRKYLKLSSTQWEAREEHEKEDYLHKELWIKAKFDEWKHKQEAEMKAKLADNSRYKMYRRYMKKGGPGQMSFGPD